MKSIIIHRVEGSTSKKGSKQNKTYTIVRQHGIVKDGNGRDCDLTRFYTVTDGKREYTIWNLNGDWSRIGICKGDASRFTYTSDFTVIDK